MNDTLFLLILLTGHVADVPCVPGAAIQAALEGEGEGWRINPPSSGSAGGADDQGGRAPREACVNLNEDSVPDLCALLVGRATDWQLGCFVSRGDGAYKVETLFEPSDERERGINKEMLALRPLRAGESITWANGAAVISFKRDCIVLEQAEASSAVYCYNGAYFVSADLTD